MAEMQALLDFPPAPKLNLYGRLDPSKASQAEMRGEALFFGKANCAVCHTPPFYTDNLMHNLKVERFYKPQTINGMVATAQGLIKTFPLRGIKESPPYLHDGRLPTLEDVVEFFNLILETEVEQGGEGRPGGLPAGALRRNPGTYTHSSWDWERIAIACTGRLTESVPRAVASGLHAPAALATARGTDPYCHLSMPYIDLQSALGNSSGAAQAGRIAMPEYKRQR